MKKLILWDLDGTLLDTLEDLAAAVNYALQQRDLPLLDVTDYRKLVGHGIQNLMRQSMEVSLQRLPAPERPATERLDIEAGVADFKSWYSAHIDVHSRPYDGMPELLAELQDLGVRMAVTSNKFQEGTERLIREFFPGIDFVAILGNRPGCPLKPSPEIVGEVLEKAAVERKDAILVGDSPTDMRTAANGGIDGLAVSWGYRTVEDLSGFPIVHDPGQLRNALLSAPADER